MNASNNDIFYNVVRPIVDAAVNGYNGTVFTYGQSSSGKTYTMMGTSAELGVIPLAVEYMFDAIANTPGREFLLRVSYLEIYNEKVIDLLHKDSIDLKIHEDANGNIFVKCKEKVTNCPESVFSIINKGNKRRVGKGNMNEQRSHTIFRITIESREADTGGTIQISQIKMVDLAGSEGVRQIGATGEQFKEGPNNKSLFALALVVKQLSETQDSQKHINFRDSKLTRLLKASLGGNSITVIICAITPAAVDETQFTLAFASRARNIKNTPKLNEVTSDDVLLKRYTRQIATLRAELERLKLTQTTNFQEMESKMQEKDLVNQNLEERIRLLQTRIVTFANRNNATPSKTKEKKRQTWCGAFQTAFADFELELINNEADRDEENEESDEDHKRSVKFMDDVIVSKSPSNYNDSTECEKIDTSIQTESYQSPGSSKQILRDRPHSSTDLEKKVAQLSAEDIQTQNVPELLEQLTLHDGNNNLQVETCYQCQSNSQPLKKCTYCSKRYHTTCAHPGRLRSPRGLLSEICPECKKNAIDSETRITRSRRRINIE